MTTRWMTAATNAGVVRIVHEHTRIADGCGDRCSTACHDRDTEGHGFHGRYAEPLVLAQGEEDLTLLEDRRQLSVGQTSQQPKAMQPHRSRR